jgi:hypothetical protein
MRFVLLLLVLTICVSNLHATNYYFSSVSGDDSRTAVQAQSPSTPWKSLDKFNAVNPSLRPGDSVFFKRGETFYGVMNVRSSGVSGNVIYYGAYGTGASPVISGFVTLTSWTAYGSGIYYTPLDVPTLNMVTINGEAKGMGRYPNTGFLNYENNNANLSITDNELPASPNWTGAEIVMRKYRFILDRHTVTSQVGTTLNYSSSETDPTGNNAKFLPVKGNGYFFQNSLQTLDVFGEWYYDPTAKRLYVHFGGGSPSSYVVKASSKDLNASVETVDYVTLENLSFEGANQKGMNISYATNVLVQNCSFSNQGSSSIYGDHISYVTIKGGSVNTSFSNGINFEHNANNCTIDGVSVSNSNMIPGSGRSGTGASIGISVFGDNTTIINNRIKNSGYSGIQFIGNNVLIEKNYIDTFCTIKDDGGGVYTFEGGSNETNFNRKIRNNIILNAIGAQAGAEAYYYEPFGKGAGIYLDEYVNNVEITGNTIANGDWGGIFLHNAHDCQINNNIIYNHRYQVHVSQYAPASRNMVETGNQYIAKQAAQEVWYYRTYVADDPSTMGTSNNNYFARPIDDSKTIHCDFFQSGGSGTQYFTLDQWKTNFKLDAASLKSPITYKANINDSIRFEYNDGNAAKLIALDASYLDVKGTQYSGYLSLAPFTSVVLLKSPTAFKSNQVITFPAIADKSFGGSPFTLNATSTSGLAVSYRVVSGPATVSGNTVTMTGLGTVVIEASQAGNTTYKAADPVTQSFSVLPPNGQTITFPAIPNKAYGDAPFTLTATASSGLPVSYKLISGLATINGSTVTITSAGISMVIIEASQAGNNTYKAATPVRQSFLVSKGSQTISFGALADKAYGDPAFALTATATSGLPVSYKVLSGPATLSGNMVTVNGIGQVTIEASQLGDTNYNAAAAVSQIFTVNKASQTITFPALPNKTFGDAPFNLTATSSSGLPVSYRILSGPATLSGTTVTMTGVGEVWIEASQAGNTFYNPATALSRNFIVNPNRQNQTITFPAISAKTFGDAPFALTATASSGLPISYRVLSGPATISGNTVTITGVGEIWIEASQAGNANYNAAAVVNQNFPVNKANQTITFPAPGLKTYGDAPFALTATATSGLPVSYRVVSGPATLSGNMVTMTGSGEVWIEASQLGNSNYNAATSFSQNFYIVKGSQTITFPSIPAKTLGDPPFVLNAMASSGLPVTYRVLSGPATVSGNVVTITGTGSGWIEASQAGDNNYDPATTISQNFTVSAPVPVMQNQTITFGTLSNKTYGDAPFTLTATASSGLPVSYRIVSGPATVSGNTVTITGAGFVTIEASQVGNTTYNAATAVQQSFTVNKAAQTITFLTLPNKLSTDPAFALTATASSGLPVLYRVISGPATITGNVVTLTGVGTVVIEATQPGDGNYNAATAVQQSFTVASPTKTTQTITFPAIASKTIGDAPFTISATASSGLPVSFRIVSGPATISGNTVTITGVGTVSIEASQAGNITYAAATPVTQSVTINKASQTITFATLSNKNYGDAPFVLSATASSGLSVSYRVVSGPATISGSTVTITGAGFVTIEASQAGNTNYNAATVVQQSFTVNKGSQSITFGTLASKTYGDAPFVLNATATSGLLVSYRVVSGLATVTGNTVTITGVGTVIVEASQAGDANFNAATAVQQSFAVNKAAQTITFAALTNKAYNDAPFTLNATASSGLPVSYRIVSGPATVSGNTVTITGLGVVTVEASQAGNTTYNAATAVQQSFTVGKGSQTITFSPLANKNYGDAPFTINASASSGLAVSFRIVSGPATISGNMVTITGAGTVIIEASQAGNTNYNAATPVQQSLTINNAAQTITFGPLATKSYGDAPFTVSATASSGLPVSFRIVSGPATISGNTVTLTGTGTVVIEASQIGNTNYAAATPVTQSFNVVNPTNLSQTITFAALTNKTFGDAPFTVTATASSGLPVSFRIVSGPATVSGNLVTITGAGTVTIEASQPGNATYNAATPIQQSFTVAKASQSITFGTLASKTFGDAPFTVGATASSGLPVSYRIVSGPATISGNTVTIIGAGTVIVEASQPGNTNYNAATALTQSFIVSKASQAITFAALSTKTFGDAPFTINATASSGLPVLYRVVSGPATISGNTVTLTGAGTVTIEASQPGDGNYNAATSVQQSFTVASPTNVNQTITFAALANKTYGDAPFAVSATATSGLPVSFRIVSGPATISGNTVTITGAGSVTIEASQAGNATYNPATPVQQSFIVAKAAQTITFAALSNKNYGDAPFALTATASSGLPVSFRVISGPATVSGNTVTITGAGLVTIEASQTGNANYNTAAVTQSFTVNKASQFITFAALSNKTLGDAPFTVNATASSGLPVSFRVVSGPATISGNTVTITGGGIVSIEASQAGDANYNAAAVVTQSFTVAATSQTITFGPLSNKTFGDAPFALNATASSGLPVSYKIVSGPATVSGNTVTITGAGAVTIEASQTGNTNYGAASPVQQSFTVAKASQIISFAAIPGKTYGDAPFVLNALASSGLPVSFRVVSGPATISGTTVTLTGTGTVTIEASQAGNANYNAATPVQQSFSVTIPSKQNQVITFPAIPNKAYGAAPFTITATASSGLPVSFKVVSGPATVSGNTVTITGGGTVIIEASQDGNTSYNAAAPVQQSFTVAKLTQSITFPALANKTYGALPFSLGATSSSGLPVSYRVVSGLATVSGDMLTITGAGSVTIEASQPGDGNYNAAVPVSRSFTVTKASQSISFPSPGNMTFDKSPLTLTAMASSGLPVSYRVVSGPATVKDNVLTFTDTGKMTIEASQAGDANYNAATAVKQTFTVSKGTQTITFTDIPDKTYGDAPFALNATASSGLPVSYKIVSGPATVSGGTLTITGIGIVTVEASQAGNKTFNSAAAVRQSFTVSLQAKQNQVITFAAIPDKTFGDAPFTVGATASSGLPVSYRIVSGPATISGNTVTIIGAGTVTVEASQPGNTNYNAATPVQQSFTVAPASVKQFQLITFGTLADKYFGEAPFTLTATASSGLPVNYRVTSGNATISGNTVTITGVGTVWIEASQPGDASYFPAPSVSQSFYVSKGAQTITFPAIPNKTFGDAPFALTAIASSGLPVSYKVLSGPATVSGNMITLTGTGEVWIEASQPGDANYNLAVSVARNFFVSASAPVTVNQTITFPAVGYKTFGDAPFTLNATASSGLPVNYSVISGPATVSGNTLTLTGAGTVTIQASQTGNATYNAATPVTQSFSVNKAAQTITFAPLANRTFGDAPFDLSATATSGLPVSFKVVSGPATISGSTVTITDVGTVTIEASQAGDANYDAANPVTQSFSVISSSVTKQSQTINFGTLGYKTYTSPSFELNATASSGLPVSYRVVSGPVTIAGNMVTITGVGLVIIEASQAGDGNFFAATPVQRNFTVGKASQVITFAALANKTYGDAPFALNATASSGLPVQYRVVSGPATVSGNTVTLTGTGTVYIEASQPGNDYFTAAYPPVRSFSVTAALTVAPSLVQNTVGENNREVSLKNDNIVLSLYPNPIHSQGLLQVVVPSSTQGYLSIYNLEGKLVRQLGEKRFEKGRPQLIPVDVQGLRNGTYILRFVTKNKVVSQTFQVL